MYIYIAASLRITRMNVRFLYLFHCASWHSKATDRKEEALKRGVVAYMQPSGNISNNKLPLDAVRRGS